jgi:hypothetical protein
MRMMRRAPWPSSTFWFDSNCFMGSYEGAGA